MRINKKIIILAIILMITNTAIACNKDTDKVEDLGSGIIFTKATGYMKDQYVLRVDNKNYLLKTDDHNTFSTSTFYKDNLYYSTKNSKGYSNLIKFNIKTQESTILPISNDVDNIDTMQSVDNILFLRVVKKGEHSMGLVKYNMDNDKYEFFNYDSDDDMLMDFNVRGKYIVYIQYSDKEMQDSMGKFNTDKSPDKVFNCPPHRITVANIETGEKVYEKSIPEMIESVTLNKECNKIAYIHSSMKSSEEPAKLTIEDLNDESETIPNINKENYLTLEHVRFGDTDNELYYIARSTKKVGEDNVKEVIKYDIEKGKIVQSIYSNDSLLKYFTILPSIKGNKEFLDQYLKEDILTINDNLDNNIENHSSDNNDISDSKENEPTEYKETELKTSDIPVKYTLEQSKSNGDYIFISEEEISFNRDKLDSFIDSVNDKKPSKIRYTQYYEGFLSRMRDVEYDGEKIILKEYDTKSVEKETYCYLEITDSDLIFDGHYYRLKDKGLKVFSVN